MLPRNRPPTHPGEMLLHEYLAPRQITQVELAARMGVPIQRVNTLVNGKRGVTADTAILLAEVLGTTPEFWMGLQASFDLWHALRQRERKKSLALGALGATEPAIRVARRRRGGRPA